MILNPAPLALRAMAQISIQNARTLFRGSDDQLDHEEDQVFSTNYLSWAHDDIAVMRAGHAELERAVAWGDATAADGLRQSILATAQAVSEQAGTFGFTLVAEIADSLCAMLEIGERPRLSPIEAHLAALERAIALGLKGDGGAIGADLITRLPH
jgi:hypothetical protein